MAGCKGPLKRKRRTNLTRSLYKQSSPHENPAITHCGDTHPMLERVAAIRGASFPARHRCRYGNIVACQSKRPARRWSRTCPAGDEQTHQLRRSEVLERQWFPAADERSRDEISNPERRSETCDSLPAIASRAP